MGVGSRVISLFKALKEILVGAAVDLLELYQHADTDVELARLVFGVGASPNVTTPPLELGAELFLGNAVPIPQGAQSVAERTVYPQLLFHDISPFLTSIGCNYHYFMV